LDSEYYPVACKDAYLGRRVFYRILPSTRRSNSTFCATELRQLLLAGAANGGGAERTGNGSEHGETKKEPFFGDFSF
jgi:hypothetical protein